MEDLIDNISVILGREVGAELLAALSDDEVKAIEHEARRLLDSGEEDMPYNAVWDAIIRINPMLWNDLIDVGEDGY